MEAAVELPLDRSSRHGWIAQTMNQPINLRAASQDDEPFLLQLRKLTMTEHLERVAIPVDDEAHYQRIRSNFEDAQIICEGNRSIGLIKLSRMTDEWHVHQIQVIPSHQGRGIGKTVLTAVLNEAERIGVPVTLSVLHGNPARRLYDQLGFQFVAELSKSTKLIWHP
jgi:ribosomal protein S18 acetylase RimI-like enzyme